MTQLGLFPAGEPAKAGVFDDPEHYPGRVLWQPYAGAMRLAALGYPGKEIETRKGRILYRGPLVIVAGLAEEKAARPRVYRELVARGIPEHLVDEALNLRGVAVAVGEVSDCRGALESDYPKTLWWVKDEERHAWIFSSLEPLTPFAMKGHQGFVRVPRHMVDEARFTPSPPILQTK